MARSIEHIHEEFAEQKDSIVLLCQKDPEFLALCSDFDDCVDAVRYWTDSGEPGADAKAREYGELLRALHDEIRQILKTKI